MHMYPPLLTHVPLHHAIRPAPLVLNVSSTFRFESLTFDALANMH